VHLIWNPPEGISGSGAPSVRQDTYTRIPSYNPFMTDFATMRLPEAADVIAPDGSDVRVLLRTERGSMAHFELAPGRASDPIRHRTVDEIWYVLSGCGEMWRRQGAREEVVALEPGVCVSIPVGTHFQFRASGPEPLAAVGVAMPPWPGDDEAIPVPGRWGSR
jgi:mannose-6-phosphate isomerase-like protein (cupin superfamily)